MTILIIQNCNLTCYWSQWSLERKQRNFKRFAFAEEPWRRGNFGSGRVDGKAYRINRQTVPITAKHYNNASDFCSSAKQTRAQLLTARILYDARTPKVVVRIATSSPTVTLRKSRAEWLVSLPSPICRLLYRAPGFLDYYSSMFNFK